MKTFILTCLAAAALFSFPACTTVEAPREPAVHSTTTTTEETTTRSPAVGGAVETRTIRNY